MKALTVRQPWAWLLFHGKPVENREWPASHIGPLAIHAAKGMTCGEYEDAWDFVHSFDPALAVKIPHPESLVRGAVVGVVRQIDCVRSHPSPFFCGKYGHVYADARQLVVPIPVKGALGLWDWPVDVSRLRFCEAGQEPGPNPAPEPDQTCGGLLI